MKRKFAMLLLSATMAVPIGAVVLATAGPATAATVTCTKSVSITTPPTAPTAYAAGNAGSVTLKPVPAGLKVVSVAPNAGWTFRVDTAKGNSVDVYFRMGTTRVKFEAGIEAPHRMRVVVRTCG
jgi:hypothetical protein